LKKKYIYASTVAIVLFFVGEASVRYSSQPPENYTGAEGSTCAQCHGNLNTGGGSVTTSGLPASITAGQPYDFSVSIAHAATRGRWGFSISARDANNQPVGTFSSTHPNARPNGNDLSHFNAVLQTGTSFTYNNLRWTAPANPTPAQRSVKFYFVGNAANGDFGSTGDFIYSGTLTTGIIHNNQPPVISITDPAPGASFPAGSTVTLRAAASDSDGSVTKVEFFLAGAGTAIKLSEDLASPYELTGNDIEPGNYRVVAKATDNDTAVSVSDTLDIAVTSCSGTGNIAVYGYTNISGSFISNLTSHPRYPDSPDIVTQLPAFEYGPNITDNYGGMVRGYICAPQTGNYEFYLASDDQSELWLSTDDNPANKRRIVFLTTGVGFRSWLTFTSQRSAPIRLIKGARYYIETLHKEGTGSDHLSVGWMMPNGVAEGPIPGSRLSPWTPTNARTVNGNFVELMRSVDITNKFGDLHVTATPNPGNGRFTLLTRSNSDKPVSVIVTDISGRVLERKSNVPANTPISVGDRFTKGIYFALVIQGEEQKRIKLVRE
jgi:hypothetical protein